MSGDPFDLARFVAAQDPVIDQVRRELAAGRKTSHWMWFVFPQLAGLGLSATAQRYAIGSLDEARAYLIHPALGSRLMDCVATINALEERSAEAIFGAVDAMKLRSSLTLFAAAAPQQPAFRAALLKYFNGDADGRTLELLGLSALP
jgi:uncharacterized protein (DUF1810 family)